MEGLLPMFLFLNWIGLKKWFTICRSKNSQIGLVSGKMWNKNWRNHRVQCGFCIARAVIVNWCDRCWINSFYICPAFIISLNRPGLFPFPSSTGYVNLSGAYLFSLFHANEFFQLIRGILCNIKARDFLGSARSMHIFTKWMLGQAYRNIN